MQKKSIYEVNRAVGPSQGLKRHRPVGVKCIRVIHSLRIISYRKSISLKTGKQLSLSWQTRDMNDASGMNTQVRLHLGKNGL